MKRVLKLLASVKITVVCLLLLFVLTFWGTVAQVEHGLYAAQERYFYSLFFNIFGLVPFPGAHLVLWVLFVNLTAAAITHFSKTRGLQSIGLKISHLGVLVYFIAAFVTFHCAQESYVRLREGEGTNVSAAYREWELASWKESGNERHVTAYDVADMKSSAPESLPVKTGDHYSSLRHKRYPLPFTLRLKEFKVEFHPGTDVAKSYESAVEIIKPDAKRDARIYMNNPLRDKDYTFYQASYDIDAMGRKYSTLAVVRNAGRILPYIACFTVFLGLTVHFLMAAFRRKRI